LPQASHTFDKEVDRVAAFGVHEKSQVQAPDRSQPMLPMRPGQPARRSHDYKRHGPTSLFATLDIATGAVIGKCYARHRAREFRKFLEEIEAAVPEGLDVHLVMDKYATHKTPLIRGWLAKEAALACAFDAHQRITAQPRSSASSPSSPSARLVRMYRSVVALHADIMSFTEAHKADPKPSRWTKSADAILASIERFCAYNQPRKRLMLRTSGSGH
jgi:hypothetical protein